MIRDNEQNLADARDFERYPKASSIAGVDFLSACQLAQAIRRRELSSVEATTNLLNRIQRLNLKLKAIVTVMGDSALERARRADETLARHEDWGCLHGVPCTVRDSFDTAGVRTTAGTSELRDYVPASNAAVVDRLLAAGGIIVAKTNMPAQGLDWQTYNDLFGTTNNPWDLARTPGGSSGGCAAAVAAGLSYLSIGSDLAGSIRIPAAFCGVYGHKPSLNLVPSKGHILSNPGRTESGPPLGVRGPLARDASDLKLALEVLAGGYFDEQRGLHGALPPPRRARMGDYRIGFVLDDPYFPTSAEVRGALEGAIEALKRAGVLLEPGWPNDLILENQYKAYQYLPIASDTLHLQRQLTSEKCAAVHEGLRQAIPPSWPKLKKQLFSNKEAQFVARRLWQDYFKTHDVFLLPAVFVPAFLHDHSEPWDQRWIETSGAPQPYLHLPFWASFATVAGLPATVVPIGLTAGGLPVGIQIVGPYLEDLTPIDLAHRLSELLGGFRPPPGCTLETG